MKNREKKVNSPYSLPLLDGLKIARSLKPVRNYQPLSRERQHCTKCKPPVYDSKKLSPLAKVTEISVDKG